MDYRHRGRGAHASFEQPSTDAWPDDDGRRPYGGQFDTDDGHRGAHRDPDADRYPQGGRHRGAEPSAEPPGRGRSGAHPGRPVTDPTDWRPDTSGGQHADAAEYVPDAHPGLWESLGYARDWQAPIGGGGGRRRADETGAWGRSQYSDPQPSDRAGAYQPPDRHELAEPGEWDRSDTGQWDLSAGDGTRDSSAGAGKWDWFVDTGQWHRFTDTGEWRSDLLDLDPPVDDGPGSRPRHSRPDGFWSGTRLAGDDPRWMETPTSAPRSPAVADPIPPGSGPDSPPRPRIGPTPPRRTVAPPVEDDLLHAQSGRLLASVLYTAAWYAVPLLVFFVWMLTLDASLAPGCGTAVPGGDCESERAHAVGSILTAGPRFGGALLASLVVSVLLRWANRTWRAASVGLAAAVIGGGLSTLLVSVISGRPLG